MSVGSDVFFLEANILTNCLLKPSPPHKKTTCHFSTQQVTPVTLRI